MKYKNTDNFRFIGFVDKIITVSEVAVIYNNNIKIIADCCSVVVLFIYPLLDVRLQVNVN